MAPALGFLAQVWRRMRRLTSLRNNPYLPSTQQLHTWDDLSSQLCSAYTVDHFLLSTPCCASGSRVGGMHALADK